MTLRDPGCTLLRTIQTLTVGKLSANSAFAHTYPPPLCPTQPTLFVREQKGRQQGVGKQSSINFLN